MATQSMSVNNAVRVAKGHVHEAMTLSEGMEPACDS